MSESAEFRAEVYQNEYLPQDATEVDAVVTVTSTGAAGPSGTAAAQLVIIDCSGSMESGTGKFAAAKQATAAAIDTLRDGVAFGVIAGTHVARQVFPASGGLVAADPRSRAEAKAAVGRLRADGGTAIGTWLNLAARLFGGHPDAIRHAILLTDGKNEHEKPAELDASLAACAGVFTCDCRGVGTDWVVAELRKVASTLLGSVDIVADPAGLEADFRAMTEAAMGKSFADIRLRLWTPRSATVTFVKQVAPVVADLSSRRVDSGPQRGDYPTGSWGAESRDYHVGVRVNAGQVGDEMLAARVSLVAVGNPEQVLAQGLVRAVWTDDAALSTRINPRIAHYTGQAELAEAIQEGLRARKAGDEETATAKLGRAVALATESGNDDTAKLLAKVVEVIDPATGTVRLKKKVAAEDEMTLDTRSTKTVRVGKGTGGPPAGS